MKEWAYRKVFCTEYNGLFGAPKPDTCQVCDSINTINVKIEAEDDPGQKQNYKWNGRSTRGGLKQHLFG